MINNKPVYLPGLNGLRAIAALAVVLSHTNVALSNFGLRSMGSLLLAGFGVTIFFVISGFLITYLLLLEKDNQRINIGNFYIRRILRIWPLYYLFIVICILAVNQPELSSSTIFYYLFFAANIPFILEIGIAILVHLWSIGVEEQFYLFWPWVVRQNSKQLLKITIIIIISLFSVKIMARFLVESGTDSILYRTINVTRFHCMLIGAAGAILFKNKSQLFLKLSTNRFIQIIAWGALLLVAINKFHVFRIIDHEIIAVVTLILIMGQISNTKRIINLENPILDYLGKISYGIYVYHPLLILLWVFILNKFTIAPLALYILIYVGIIGLTLLTAHLSFTYYERPFLVLKKKFTTISSANSMKEKK